MAILKTKNLLSKLKTSADAVFKRETSITTKLLNDYLSESEDIVLRAHKDGLGGISVCKLHTFVVDEMLCRLHAAFIKRRARKPAFCDKFCMVATGGYGRDELCIKSDIDLMFLYDENSRAVPEEFKSAVIDEIIYPLWDTGLKLSHCSRNLDESLQEAKDNVLTRTAMLDARLICGAPRPFAKGKKDFKLYCSQNAQSHIDELFRLKRDRHLKYGWTPYLQEPNVKNGIGGLRDYQTIEWMAQLKYGGGMRELARKQIISLSEYKSIRKAYDYLLRIRNDMHITAKRPNDLLDFATQIITARHLGFKQRDIVVRSEKFMRKVYFCFRDIDNISKSARKRMKLELPEDVLASITPQDIDISDSERLSVDGFWISKGLISPKSKNVFQADPTRLIKVFKYCQKYGAIPSDKLEVLLKDSIRLIDDSVRANPEANRAFSKILSVQGNVAPILERMHFWGVLGAFIKEFDELTCLVQHEFYHRYTADVHTLNTIAELDKIFRSHVDDFPYGAYHAVITNTQSPTILYFILLLHDIGKAEGIKGHARVSAEISESILRRFEIPSSVMETALFVIENHLMMARFWQTNDVEDEKSVERFVEMVGDEERLKYLYVMTFCDAKATSSDLWNSYKQSLHTFLYRGTLRKMRSDESQIRDLYQSKKAKVLTEVLMMEEFSKYPEEVLSHFENLPRNYFLFHGRDDLVMHLRMIHTLLQNRKDVKSAGNVSAIFEWMDDPNQSMSKLCVVSEESEGIFYKLAGALTLAGLNILSSKILSRSDGITIDTFYLTGIGGGPVSNERIRLRFEHEFKRALESEIYLSERIEALWKNTKIPFKTEAMTSVSVLGDGSHKRVIEISAYDSEGLLYKVAKTITEEGYDIGFARINTERNWAHDTFIASRKTAGAAEADKHLAAKLKKMLSTNPEGGESATQTGGFEQQE